jgi:hypothetical protein
MTSTQPRLDLHELARTLDALEEESSDTGLPIARDRAVMIARHLLERLQALETTHAEVAG